MKFSKEEFTFLINELKNTHILTESELGYVKSAHPQLYYTTKNDRNMGVSLYTDEAYLYSLNNTILNEFICKKFNEPIENLYMVHRLIYGKGGRALKHKDRFTTHKTVSIVLSDNFEGGDMYINDKRVELNSSGDYLCFNGGKDVHEVKEVISGYRDVLIIWFSKKQSKFNII